MGSDAKLCMEFGRDLPNAMRPKPQTVDPVGARRGQLDRRAAPRAPPKSLYPNGRRCSPACTRCATFSCFSCFPVALVSDGASVGGLEKPPPASHARWSDGDSNFGAQI